MRLEINRPINVLLAENNLKQQKEIYEAIDSSTIKTNIRLVKSGEDVLDYLFRGGKFKKVEDAPRPGIIIIDLNLPEINTVKVIRAIKNYYEFKDIPIIVTADQSDERSINDCYALGVKSFLIKPLQYNVILSLIADHGRYWIEYRA